MEGGESWQQSQSAGIVRASVNMLLTTMKAPAFALQLRQYLWGIYTVALES